MGSTAMIPGPGGVMYPVNVQQRKFPPNAFNRCLDDEQALWSWVQKCGGIHLVCPGSGVRYNEPPWVRMPPQGKRYSKISSIPLPGVEGVQTLVATRIVPEGYDSCVVSTINGYTGMGFQEGSGDLIWRIQINLRYVKDYGNVTTSIGSLQTPYNVNSGQILVQSNQVVSYYVTLGAGALGRLVGGRIICALFGWDWPR